MSEVNDLHQQWMKDDPEHRQAYAELAPEFELAHALIKARVTAGLTQEQLAAERMETSQSFVAWPYAALDPDPWNGLPRPPIPG